LAATLGAAPGTGAALKLDGIANFDQPVYVHGPPGAGKIVFVVEQPGVVKVLRGDRKLKGSFLNIKSRVSCCGERGLLSIAFPDFKRDRRFYVYFTDNEGDLRVVEYKRKRGKLEAAPRSARDVLRIPHPSFENHNGGQLQFGPDGLLYIGTGDGGSANDPRGNAQDKGSLLGKLLRINPLRKRHGKPYGIPASNPYSGEQGRDEIYARGLRNPWRFSFDRRRIVIGDVGQDRAEEIDYETIRGARGANFGWDAFEGNSLIEPPAPSAHDRPIHTYSHAGRGCAITGGYVVRDRRLGRLRGRYVYADFCRGQIRSLVPHLGRATGDRSLGLRRVEGLSSFGVDDRRRLYVAAVGGGVWRLVGR
jgi:glucose/arabinose dehydrogenase